MRPAALLPALIAVLLPAAPGLAPAPAAASTDCDEIWGTRNALFWRAGYCFTSPLGLALFGNLGCRPGEPAPPAADRAAVARMQALEDRIGCRTDTRAPPTAAQIAVLARIVRLVDIPEPDELGFACWGYLGAPFPLHAGASAASPQTGTAPSGLSLVYDYDPRNGWSYVRVVTGPGGGTVAEGWSDRPPPTAQCRETAG
jgi:hypothetical protein